MGRDAGQPQPCPVEAWAEWLLGKCLKKSGHGTSLVQEGCYPAFQLDWGCQHEQTPLWQVEPGVSLAQSRMQPRWGVLCRSQGSCSVSPCRIAVPGLVLVVDFWTKRQSLQKCKEHIVWQGGSSWCPCGPGFVVSCLVAPPPAPLARGREPSASLSRKFFRHPLASRGLCLSAAL